MPFKSDPSEAFQRNFGNSILSATVPGSSKIPCTGGRMWGSAEIINNIGKSIVRIDYQLKAGSCGVIKLIEISGRVTDDQHVMKPVGK